MKNSCSDYSLFASHRNQWTVNCYHGLRADVYLFTKMDPINKKLALIGWLTPEEIVEKGQFVKCGELVYGRPSNGDCYVVKIADLHPID